jgi:uncharacterized membrane protein
MYTFHRQSGYMMNNGTSEVWTWKQSQYQNSLHQAKDYENPFFWLFDIILGKFSNLMCACFGFMILSFVNGLVIRIALLCSNIVIVPMVWLVGVFTGQELATRNRQIIYHSMGMIGA